MVALSKTRKISQFRARISTTITAIGICFQKKLILNQQNLFSKKRRNSELKKRIKKVRIKFGKRKKELLYLHPARGKFVERLVKLMRK